MITQEQAKAVFEYREGKLYWRISPSTNIKIGQRAGSSKMEHGYWRISFNKKQYHEHRLVFLMFHGFLPRYIDHINTILDEGGNIDNSIENLREISHKRNCQRAKKRPTRQGSRFRGLSWDKRTKKWRVRIGGLWLGRYINEIKAAQAYDVAAKDIYGQYCFVNFPS